MFSFQNSRMSTIVVPLPESADRSSIFQPVSSLPSSSPAADKIELHASLIGALQPPHAPPRAPLEEISSPSARRRQAPIWSSPPLASGPASSVDAVHHFSAVQLPADRAPQSPPTTISSVPQPRRPAHLLDLGPPPFGSSHPGDETPGVGLERQPLHHQIAASSISSTVGPSSSSQPSSPAIQASGAPWLNSPAIAPSSPPLSAAASPVAGVQQPSTAAISFGLNSLTGQSCGQQMLTGQTPLTGQPELFGQHIGQQSPLTGQLTGQTVDSSGQPGPALTSLQQTGSPSVPFPVFTDSTKVTFRTSLHNAAPARSFRTALLGGDPSPNSSLRPIPRSVKGT